MAHGTTRRRVSAKTARRRLDAYPFRDWLDACRTGKAGEDEEFWLRCDQGVDYNVTTNQFRTEMHRLAARETRRREAAGEQLGVIARTTEARDSYVFLRFDEVPMAATPGYKDRQRKTEDLRASGICRLTMPPHTTGKPPTGITCPCTGEEPTQTSVVVPPPALPAALPAWIQPAPPNSETPGMEQRVEHGFAVVGLPDEPKAGDVVDDVPVTATFIAPGGDEPAPAFGDGFGGLSFDEWLAAKDSDTEGSED